MAGDDDDTAVAAPEPTAPAELGAPDDELFRGEVFWRDHQVWLEERGYVLRPRYKPGWVPSWKDTGKREDRCEDAVPLKLGRIMDAKRALDGEMVVLKRLMKTGHPFEADIGLYLSSEPFASDPRNHCVRVYEALEVPDKKDEIVLVMAFMRKYQDPGFETVGEVMDFLHQIFEGLTFMHELDVAHRDCNGNNIMMDPKPLFPDLYHPVKTDRTLDLRSRAKYFSRTERSTKYYLVDFGLSRRYKPEDRPPSEPIIQGGDKSVPEHNATAISCDPFPTDIYYIGNMVRQDLLKNKSRLDFLTPLIIDMTQDDPSKRPTMEQVMARFEEIRKPLAEWKLSERLASRKEFFVFGMLRDLIHRGRLLKNRL